MDSFDITALVNAHREGLLVRPSLSSLSQTVADAEENGLRVEVLIVLDRPDALTEEIIQSYHRQHPNTRLLKLDHGDPGLSRNSGIAAARGKQIALLDADDLWGRNWLTAAYRAAERDPRPIVWHPEVCVYFGDTPHLLHHMDMEDLEYDHAKLAITNYWTALCFAPRSLFQDVPYAHTRLQGQIGFEDWSWNVEVITHGWLHKVVPGTGHAIRRKEVSVLQQSKAARCLPHPPNLFRRILEQRHAGTGWLPHRQA